MIIKNTLLKVADNSGAKHVLCIGLFGKRCATSGDVIVVSVKDTVANSKIKKGKVCKAVIVRTKYPTRKADGSIVRFSDNAVVLINDNSDPIGTRVSGAVRRLDYGKFLKLMSLAVEVI